MTDLDTMRLVNTAKASLRYKLSPAAAATIASEFLKDLIAAGHLGSDKVYLACDPSKLVRARKTAMGKARQDDKEKHQGVKITGMGYNGRKDKQTRTMVADSEEAAQESERCSYILHQNRGLVP